MGGLAVAIPMYVGVGLLYLWPNIVSDMFFAGTSDIQALLLGGLLVLTLGIYDDLRGADATMKFSFQILAAVVVCVVSGPVRSVSFPLVGEVELGLAAIPVTLLWIVAVTNAFNLIDGVDGLAAGVGALVCGVSFFIAYMHGRVYLMVLAAIMTGSLIAFLRYNFYPASIFLGDTGSLFIGFTIAVMSFQSSMEGPTTVLILIPICVLGYPLLDMSLAVVRRALKGKPIFSSDRSHIHHKLLASGLGHRATSMVAYGMTLLFVGLAIFHIYGRDRATGVLLIVTLAVLAMMFRTFGYWEFVRDRLKLTLRRKYRIYNLVAKTIWLKMEDATNLDELWALLCNLGQEFDLHSMQLHLSGSERKWRNPTAEGSAEHSVREIDLGPGVGSLRTSHDGQKDWDILTEQNILLEKTGEKLSRNLRRLRGT